MRIPRIRTKNSKTVLAPQVHRAKATLDNPESLDNNHSAQLGAVKMIL